MYTTLVLEWSIGTHHNAFIIYIIRSHYYLGISFAYSIILWFIILIFLSHFFLAYILVLINYFGSKYAVQTPSFRVNWHFSLVIFCECSLLQLKRLFWYILVSTFLYFKPITTFELNVTSSSVFDTEETVSIGLKNIFRVVTSILQN